MITNSPLFIFLIRFKFKTQEPACKKDRKKMPSEMVSTHSDARKIAVGMCDIGLLSLPFRPSGRYSGGWALSQLPNLFLDS